LCSIRILLRFGVLFGSAGGFSAIPDPAPKDGDLPKETLCRLGGCAKVFRARRNITYDAGLCPNARSVTDPQVAGNADLTRENDLILQHGRTGYTCLRHDDAG